MEGIVITKADFQRLFDKTIKCHQLLHPEYAHCTTANCNFIKNCIIGCGQFFAPMYLLQLLIKNKKVDAKFAKYILRSYLRTLIFSTIYGGVFLGSNCLIRNVTGQFNYYSFAFWPGFFCGMAIFVESPITKYFNTLIYLTVAIEALINNAEFYGWFKRTRANETLTFMTLSSTLTYMMIKQSDKAYHNLWFYTSELESFKDPNAKNKHVCDDKSFLKCLKNAGKGVYKYFLVGYAIEVAKTLIGRLGSVFKSPTNLLRIIFNKNNFYFGLITGSYVGLFRMILCYLKKRDHNKLDKHYAIAGFLSGSVYFIQPNLQFGITTITTIVQLLLQRVQNIQPLPNYLLCLSFAFLNGYLLHNRFLSPKTCPSYTKNMTAVCTNRLSIPIQKRLHEQFKELL